MLTGEEWHWEWCSSFKLADSTGSGWSSSRWWHGTVGRKLRIQWSCRCYRWRGCKISCVVIRSTVSHERWGIIKFEIWANEKEIIRGNKLHEWWRIRGPLLWSNSESKEKLRKRNFTSKNCQPSCPQRRVLAHSEIKQHGNSKRRLRRWTADRSRPALYAFDSAAVFAALIMQFSIEKSLKRIGFVFHEATRNIAGAEVEELWKVFEILGQIWK